MGKLIFRYGTMNSGKSLNLICTALSMDKQNVKYWLMKSSVDTRDPGVIKSRALSGKNSELSCIILNPDTDIYDLVKSFLNDDNENLYILVDECQFLTSEQIDEFAKVVDTFSGIDVICYGLRTDFKTHLFPGSKRLFEIADKFEEISSKCNCGRNAFFNCRIDSKSNKIATEGEQIECGAEDKYITLCRSCYCKAIEKSSDKK